MGTRTYSRRRSDGTRVLTALGRARFMTLTGLAQDAGLFETAKPYELPVSDALAPFAKKQDRALAKFERIETDAITGQQPVNYPEGFFESAVNITASEMTDDYTSSYYKQLEMLMYKHGKQVNQTRLWDGIAEDMRTYMNISGYDPNGVGGPVGPSFESQYAYGEWNGHPIFRFNPLYEPIIDAVTGNKNTVSNETMQAIYDATSKITVDSTRPPLAYRRLARGEGNPDAAFVISTLASGTTDAMRLFQMQKTSEQIKSVLGDKALKEIASIGRTGMAFAPAHINRLLQITKDFEKEYRKVDPRDPRERPMREALNEMRFGVFRLSQTASAVARIKASSNMSVNQDDIPNNYQLAFQMEIFS